MEGLFIHTASKLESIRTGNDCKKRADCTLSKDDITSWPVWRAALAEFLAQVLFVFLGGCTAMITGPCDDCAKVVKVSINVENLVSWCFVLRCESIYNIIKWT